MCLPSKVPPTCSQAGMYFCKSHTAIYEQSLGVLHALLASDQNIYIFTRGPTSPSSSLRLGDHVAWASPSKHHCPGTHWWTCQGPLTVNRDERKRVCAIRKNTGFCAMNPQLGGRRVKAANDPSAATWATRMNPICRQVSCGEPPEALLEPFLPSDFSIK